METRTAAHRRLNDTDFGLPRANQGFAPGASAQVTAIIVTRRRSPYVGRTLDQVLRQTRLPGQVIVVDADATSPASAAIGLPIAGITYVAGGGLKSFGAGVQAGVAAAARVYSAGNINPGPSVHSNAGGGWLWLLHDDSAPAQDALMKLLAAVENTARVGVVGCKQRPWVDKPAAGIGDRLISVGHSVTHNGRRFLEPTGDGDQGQFDARSDMLAVSLAGALVRLDLWEHLGGTEPAYGAFGDSTDFCRRAWAAGSRVVVVPGAEVRHAQASLLGQRKGACAGHLRRRVSESRQQLAYARPAVLPALIFALLLMAPLRFARQLQSPRRALAELLAPLMVLGTFGVVFGLRRRLRVAARGGGLAVRRAGLALMVPRAEVWRQRRDGWLARHRAGGEPIAARVSAVSAGAGRAGSAAGVAFTLTLLTTGTVALLWPLITGALAGGRIAGGALLPLPGGNVALWAAATAGFHELAAFPPDPLLLVLALLAPLAGSGQALINFVMLAAIPLAGLSAWCGAGALLSGAGPRLNGPSAPRRAWVRSGAAVAWALAPALLVASAGGYLGAVVTHTALPGLVGALVMSWRSPEPRRARWAAAAAVLGLIAIAGSPWLLLPGVAFAIGSALFAPGRRTLGAVGLLPAAVIGAPYWWYLARHLAAWPVLFAPPLAAATDGPIVWSAGSCFASVGLLAVGIILLLVVATSPWRAPKRVAALAVPAVLAGSAFALLGAAADGGLGFTNGRFGDLAATKPIVSASGQRLQAAGPLLYLNGTPESLEYALLTETASSLADQSSLAGPATGNGGTGNQETLDAVIGGEAIGAAFIDGAMIDSATPDDATTTDTMPEALAALVAGSGWDGLGALADAQVSGVVAPVSASAELVARLDGAAALRRVAASEQSYLWRIAWEEQP